MSLYHFRLPDVGEGVAEAEIAVWHVQPGDHVAEDQSLVDVMTDKATVDMTSPVEGKVIAIHGAVGEMMPVGGILVELEIEGGAGGEGEVGGNPDAQAQAVRAPVTAPAPPAAVPETPPPPERKAAPSHAPAPSPSPSPRQGSDTPLAAPATRRRAHELGIPLHYVPGTGPGGRITPEDLDAFIAGGGMAAAASSPLRAREGVEESRITGLRRKIAERMEEASRRIPHISYVEECDLTELEALRADLNAHRTADQPKLTLLPFFLRALVTALPDFPHINAHYDEEAGVLRQFAGVHVGIATQTPNGLMVPVLRHAEARDLWDCAREISRLSAAARDGRAAREELSGSTITITSLGALGGIATTPILNRPEVAIIGPNKLVERPMVEGSFLSLRKMMNISSSFDHRIVDGHDAALFIQRLKRLLEHPALIFMP